jgi:hypothetical protein
MIMAMFALRFALGVFFAVLAMAGEAGVRLELIHHEGERCLICESAARLAAKASAIRNFGIQTKFSYKRRIVRDNLDENTAYSTPAVLNYLVASHFRILLI